MKVMNISSEMTRIFKAVSDNLNILQWLKGHLKGIRFILLYFT